jgi:NADPH:quinone reductase-like Zn-dependent oxidoreductase
MRAVVVTEFGGPEVLRVQEMPVPVPGDYDLLVEVYASSINPIDFKIRKGAFAKNRELPIILGFDVSGVVRVKLFKGQCHVVGCQASPAGAKREQAAGQAPVAIARN